MGWSEIFTKCQSSLQKFRFPSGSGNVKVGRVPPKSLSRGKRRRRRLDPKLLHSKALEGENYGWGGAGMWWEIIRACWWLPGLGLTPGPCWNLERLGLEQREHKGILVCRGRMVPKGKVIFPCFWGVINNPSFAFFGSFGCKISRESEAASQIQLSLITVF